MANRERGQVDLSIGGQVYTLKLTTNAICELEESLSTPDKRVTLGEVVVSLASGSTVYARAFVWASLRKFHPKVTLEQTGDLIDDAGGVEAIFAQLAELRKSASPDAEDAATLAQPSDRP